MRKPNILMLLLLVFLCQVATGQDPKNSSTEKKQNLTTLFSNSEQFSTCLQEEKYYLQVQFERLPTKEILQRLHQLNIELLSFQSNNTYLAAIPLTVRLEDMEGLEIENVATPLATKKMSAALQKMERPKWATTGEDQLDIAINFFPGTNPASIAQVLKQFQIEEIGLRANKGTLVIGRLAASQLEPLSQEPIVSNLDFVQEPDQALNFETRNAQHINAIQCVVPGTLNLRGNGVTIGVGDGGELGNHKDFVGRVNNQATGTYSSFGAHGDHVAGIIGGSGALNPRHRGMAPESNIVTQKTSLITYYSEDYLHQYGMVLTNNSYGTTSSCDINGTYNYSSQSLDMQMRAYPEMLHVFAAGNNGWETCGDYPKSFHTVLRYYQAAKNVLTVGNVKDSREINPNSSRGPANDGRLKPEICGVGTNVMSTGRENDYWNASGTSMASPAVVGTMALMYERYRELNGGMNPKGALMKAIACNSAEDLGNEGPDYTYGFGLINALDAIKTIEADNFISGTVENGNTIQHTIAVPSNVEQVKIMLYWHDKEAEGNAEKALVNDLDLVVNTPSNTSYLPWILNTNPANVNDPATRGADHLNNIEQVTIDQATSGNYTVKISGFEVPFGPQEYFITYQFITTDVTLTFPVGGESLVAGLREKIQWETNPQNTSNFSVEWSSDNGQNWEMIKSDVAYNVRYINWTVPSTVTETARIRVTKEETSISDESDYNFSIMGVPADLAAQSVCAGYVQLDWTALDYATGYQVMMFQDEEMIPIATVTENTYTLEGGLTLGETYWFSVRAIGPEGGFSERTEAISCIPQIVTPCNWENDGLLHAGFEELRGRYNTASSLTNSEDISVTIENIGGNELTDMKLFYQIDGQTPVEESFSGTIPVGETYTYTFNQKANFSQPGEYSINAWIEIPGDTHPENDQLHEPMMVTQLTHARLTLPYIENFDGLGMSNIFDESRIGPNGLQKWDLDLGQGSLLFTEEGETGGYGLTIGNTGEDYGLYENKAILNLELSTLNGTEEEIYFIFSYKSNLGVFRLNSNLAENDNAVYLRGSENDDWIKLMSLAVDKSWAKSASINLSRVLTAAGQNFSKTTQIKFQQLGSAALEIDNISISTPSRLPVTMDTFSAKRVGEEALLEWSTVSEEGNDFFLVEMAEGVEGLKKGAYKVIGKVAGNGFSNTPNQYSFRDKSERKKGDCYYRLKQVDFGGNATNSDFRVVHFPILETALAFYPNPFMKDLNVYYESDTDQMVTIKVINGKGQAIKEYQEPFQKGRNELSLSMDTDLPGGLYSIQIIYADQKTEVFRVSKALD